MQSIDKKYIAPLLLLFAIVTFIPWLGDILFNTKGEPREAIVAVSMLKTGNWILPVSCGADIPYKPPFLAWCIATISLIWGNVTEFTSRLPSAIAAIGMIMYTYRFINRHIGSTSIAIISSMILCTCIEVWRAAWACRVDMVLTACMVGAFYNLFVYVNDCRRGLPWFAILLMTCAVLTKGPVGMLLPCLAVGIFGLLRGYKFMSLFLRLAISGILSLIVPLIWYRAAYLQGGDEFLRLVIEENFGRFTGSMSYDSHVKPIWYNFITVILGMLPYTIIAIMALFAAKYKQASKIPTIKKILNYCRTVNPAHLFAIVSTITVFIFYCIPKSKRSVYLLPIYPFLAYFITLLILWLCKKTPRIIKIYSGIIATVGLITPILLIVRPDIIPYKESLSVTDILLISAVFASAIFLFYNIYCHTARKCINITLGVTGLLLWLTLSTALPPILNAKSDKNVAMDINRIIPEGTIYSFIDIDMLRFYTANFYLDDRVHTFETELPESGYLIVGEYAYNEWLKRYEKDYKSHVVKRYDHRSCDFRQPMWLVEFSAR